MIQSFWRQLLILPHIFFNTGKVDVIELSSQRLRIIIKGAGRDGSTKDKEEQFMDDDEFESDEDSPQLSN